MCLVEVSLVRSGKASSPADRILLRILSESRLASGEEHAHDFDSKVYTVTIVCYRGSISAARIIINPQAPTGTIAVCCSRMPAEVACASPKMATATGVCAYRHAA